MGKAVNEQSNMQLNLGVYICCQSVSAKCFAPNKVQCYNITT